MNLRIFFRVRKPKKRDPVVIGFRASGNFLEKIWIPLTKRFPAKTPTQIMREAVALRAFIELVPCVIMGEMLKTENLPDVPIARRFFHIAKEQEDTTRNLSFRVSGDFKEHVWMPLVGQFPQKLPSDLLREGLILRDFVEVNNCICVIDGKETDVRAYLWSEKVPML